MDVDIIDEYGGILMDMKGIGLIQITPEEILRSGLIAGKDILSSEE
jgi:hypothetical protein